MNAKFGENELTKNNKQVENSSTQPNLFAEVEMKRTKRKRKKRDKKASRMATLSDLEIVLVKLGIKIKLCNLWIEGFQQVNLYIR